MAPRHVAPCLLLAACHPLGSLPVDSSGDPPAGWLSVSPLALDFGEVDVGEAPELAVTVQNDGDAAWTVGAVSAPVGDPEFTLGAPEDLLLAPGESAAFTVTYTPASDAAATAQLLIADADAVVTMSGTGRAAVLATGDPEIDPVVLGCTGLGTLPVWNAGSRDLEIAGVSSTSADFAVTSWPETLQPGDTGEVAFTFTPTAGGTVDAALVFDSNDPVSEGSSVAVSALGYEGEGVAESFLFEPTDPTDIVFVVDAGSLAGMASAAGPAAEAYVDALEVASVDYQLTAVSGAVPCPGSPAYTTRADTSLRSSTVLSRAFADGPGAWDGDLLGLANEVLAEAGPTGCLAGFRRAGADLEVVVAALGPSGADLAGELASLQAAAGADVRVSALVPTDGSCGTRADDYLGLAAGTSGAIADVCGDWATGFEALAELPSGAGEVRYTLAEVPVADSISVSVAGVEKAGWLWESATNEIVFDAASFDVGAEIDIGYVAAVECDGG